MRADILELTDEQCDRLVDLLEDRGFRYLGRGHIIMREAVEGIPRNEDGMPLPVGYLAGRSLFLVNLEEKFPEDYHGRLRQLHQEVTGQI